MDFTVLDELAYPTNIPDNVELFIPNKNQTLRARVQRRGTNEVGIAFEVERSDEPRRASDVEPQKRVETLETEIAALKRLASKLRAKVLPHDLDAAWRWLTTCEKGPPQLTASLFLSGPQARCRCLAQSRRAAAAQNVRFSNRPFRVKVSLR